MVKSFGIISGAGPMAGALLYRQIIELLQAQGVWQDADFPAIVLMNVPFSNMLGDHNNYELVQRELLAALEQLRQQADYIYIACQTLHAFLSTTDLQKYRIVSLLDLLKVEVSMHSKPIWVAASNTSRYLDLHRYINATGSLQYLEPEASDRAIQTILRGLKPDLNWLIEKTFENIVVLGCTEFSVSCHGMGFQWIDPLQLAARDVVKKFLHHRIC
jgi:aspartate/glutamate racemase